MKNRLIYLLSFLFLTFIFVSNSFSQDDWWKDKKHKDEKSKAKHSLCKRTFKDIASGFNNQGLASITNYFGSEVYLKILSYDKGDYSPNQAEIILSEFIDYFKIVSFKYKHSYCKNSFAFAMGKYIYDKGSGKRELNASVSLKYKDEKWIIDQISLN